MTWSYHIKNIMRFDPGQATKQAAKLWNSHGDLALGLNWYKAV